MFVDGCTSGVRTAYTRYHMYVRPYCCVYCCSMSMYGSYQVHRACLPLVVHPTQSALAICAEHCIRYIKQRNMPNCWSKQWADLHVHTFTEFQSYLPLGLNYCCQLPSTTAVVHAVTRTNKSAVRVRVYTSGMIDEYHGCAVLLRQPAPTITRHLPRRATGYVQQVQVRLRTYFYCTSYMRKGHVRDKSSVSVLTF